jgi:thiol-disulfide isomerase/thioredoxin
VSVRRIALGGVFTALLVAVAAARAQEEQIGIAVGARPQAITLEDLDGNPVDLGEYLGAKPLIIEFWATWCPLCEALMPRIEAAHAKYGHAVDFLIVAVAVNQNPRRVRRHFEAHPPPGRVLWDADGRAVRAFMAPSTSYVVALDATGKVVYTGVGAEQDIDAVAKSVRQ